MAMGVMNGPTDDDYSKHIVVPHSRLHQSYRLARTNQSRKPEEHSVPDYEGLATMSGGRVEAILYCAGQGRRIMTS